MINILTEKLAKEMADKMNLNYWVKLQTLDRCFYGCKKFRESLYIESKEIKNAKILNPKYFFHLQSTHGFPPIILMEEIAKKLYKKEEDRNKMREMYKYFDIH